MALGKYLPRCGATTVNGAPCKAKKVPGADGCVWHALGGDVLKAHDLWVAWRAKEREARKTAFAQEATARAVAEAANPAKAAAERRARRAAKRTERRIAVILPG